MTRWLFRHYVGTSGISDVRATYDRGSKKLQAKFLSRLRILYQLPQSDWHQGIYKALSGPGRGVAEIRFEVGNVQQRPLGFHSADHEFTILLWAIEKGGKFVPPSACETALKRKAEVERDRSLANDIWLALE